MNKRVVLLASTIGLAFAAVAVGASTLTKGVFVPHAAENYEIVIDDMSKIKNDQVETANGNPIHFHTDDITAEGVLKDGGYLYNTTALTGLESVSVTTEQNVKIIGGWYQTGDGNFAFDADNPFATGTGTVVADLSTAKPDFFAVVATGGSATLTNLSIDYGCSAETHTLTLHLYTTNVPNDNSVGVVLDSNWTVNNEWINEKGISWGMMTYKGTSGDFKVFDYEVEVRYGLARFEFAAYVADGDNRYVSGYDNWKPYGFYIGADTELYCYAENGFPANKNNTTTFAVYDHKLTNPYKTTFNISFAEGSADFSYVGLKTRTGSNDYAYRASLTKDGTVWSYTFTSAEDQTYDFFLEAWVSGFDGNAQFVKTTSPWAGFTINITSNEATAVVNLEVATVVTEKADYVATVASVTNCTVA